MEIRRFRHGDLEAVLAVWLAASRVGHPFLTEADLASDREKVARIYLPRAETRVAEERRIIGFVALLGGFVGGLFVHPAHHGRGVGRALIDDAAALEGDLTVDVYAANERARGFYERCGFREVSRRERDDEGRPLAVVRMERAFGRG